MPRKVVEKPFCGGMWTRARYFGFIRSALRLASRKWPPRIAAKIAARRPVKEPTNKRQRWAYQCSLCGQWHADKDVEVHHLQPCGKLEAYEDLPEFTRRLLCESGGLAVVCLKCHKHCLTSRKEKED
jgi:hypothetical protein